MGTRAKTFLGVPCLHGHDGTRYASNGQCVPCALAREKALPPEKQEAKRAYRAAWAAEKAKDPAYAALDKARRRERARVARAKRDADPARREQHLEARRTVRTGAIREVEVERYLVQEVQKRGGFCPKFVDPGRRGAPDRIVVLPGETLVFVELKRGKSGRVESWQRRYHEELIKRGQVVYIIRTHDEVDTLLEVLC